MRLFTKEKEKKRNLDKWIETTIFILIILFLLFITGKMYGQNYMVNEDFPGTKDTSAPSGWMNRTITGTSTDKWHFDDPGNRHGTVRLPLDTPFAIFDSRAYSSGGGSEDVALESFAFNTL